MPGLLPPADEERLVVTRDGETLRVRRFGDGPPMILFNGLVSSEAHWPFFVSHFSRRHSVVFWDYRGHGGHPAPRDLDTISVEHFADDAHEVLAALGRGPAISVGLSFGVQVALEHHRRHPGDARSLVLVCGTDGHPLDRVSRARWLRAAMAGLMRRFADGGRLASWILRSGDLRLAREVTYLSGGAHRELCPREVLDEVFRHSTAMDPRVFGRAFASYFRHSARDVLPRVAVPTLVMAGDRDQLTPVACAERMVAEIRRGGGDARLVTWQGHSHLVQVERPDDVHAEIESFLAGLAR